MFGPPGVGKGTHSRRLAAEIGVPHVSTGELLRKSIQEGSELGRIAEEYVGRGELVSDDLMVQILETRLDQPDAKEGYLLDGFPRTIPQAQVLHAKLREADKRMDAVLSLDAPVEVLVGRLAGRATCRQCQATYNHALYPPKQTGVCDLCGGVLLQRVDDAEKTVRRRIEEYQAKTRPILDFFRQEHWPVQLVSSVGEIEEIYKRLKNAVDAGAN